MRLAVLMSLASPWSRAAVLRLAPACAELRVVTWDAPRSAGYLHAEDDVLAAELAAFRSRIAEVLTLRPAAPGGLVYAAAAPALRRRLRAWRSDVLLTLYGGGYATAAWLCGFRPYAVYAVGSDVAFASGLKRPLARRALEAAALVLVNGRWLADRARALAPRARIEPLYLGVDPDAFPPGRPADPPGIVCARGFLPVYNNEQIVRALALLPPDLPPWTMTFTSAGPGLGAARALAGALLPPAARGRVAFLGGTDGATMAATLRAASVYVSASRSDGTSISLLEALATGLTPVLSDIPPNREWIGGDAAAGSLFPLDDPAALAEKLAAALRDGAARAAAAPRNRRVVMERANSRATIPRLADALAALT